MSDSQTTTLSPQELQSLSEERKEVEQWLLKKRCSRIDVRGEDPGCEPCKAIDLIDTLFGFLTSPEAQRAARQN